MTKKPLKKSPGKSTGKVENVDNFFKRRNKGISSKKISTAFACQGQNKKCGYVDNFYFVMESLIFTTSPAPIVINKSPLIQFLCKNFSMSSKDEK